MMDGILAMEGEGPGKSGKPRNIGIVLGSTDTMAIDFTVCSMLGIEPERLFTNQMAIEDGYEEDIKIEGDMPRITDFELPEIRTLVWGPEKFQGFVRRHIVQRPVCNDDMCRLCGECWRYCPAKAISHDKKRIHFDYDKCIRCYCCIEVCPHGALKAKETKAGMVMRRVLKV
ncbi:MAG: 4Fe-4S binding protein [Nitrospirae bacterium]|nr:4Fe-4S binding protein [Nitrospirota bacterium]